MGTTKTKLNTRVVYANLAFKPNEMTSPYKCFVDDAYRDLRTEMMRIVVVVADYHARLSFCLKKLRHTTYQTGVGSGGGELDEDP